MKYIPKSLAVDNSLPSIMTSGVSLDYVTFLGIDDSRKFLKDDNGNEYNIYCLDKAKEWPNNVKFKKSASPLNNGYQYIALNGFPSSDFMKGTGASDADKYYLTQIALWFYQDRSNGVSDGQNGVLTASEKSTIISSSYYTNYIKPLIDGALSAKEKGVKPSPVIGASNNSLSYSRISGKDYLVSSNISVNSDNPFEDYQVSIDVSNYEILNQSGTVFRKVVNGDVTKNNKLDSSSSFVLRVPLDELEKKSNRKITITVLADYIQRDTYLYTPEQKDDNVQDAAVAAVEATNKSISKEIVLTAPTGELTVIKHDMGNNNLQGAKLLIKNNYGYSKEVITTNTPIVLSNLIPTVYTVTELEAPSGYLIDSDKNVEVVASSNKTVTMVDKKIELSIKKVDKDDPTKFVSGATINVYKEGDLKNPVISFITGNSDSDNTYLINKPLSFGTYYVKEVKAPVGYVLDDTSHKIVFDENNTSREVVISNKAIVVEIAKVDSNTNSLIPGAKLKLMDEEGKEIETWITTTSKKVFKALKPGNYVLVEVSSAQGYISNGNKLTFEVKNTGKVQSVSMVDNYVSLTVDSKKLLVDTNKVKGFKFVLTKKDGTKIDEWTSDEKIHITKELENGTYVLTELKVPKGYVNISSPYEFVISDQGTLDTVKLVNKPITVNISKKDFTNGKELAGAKLVLKDSSDKVIDTWVSTTKPHEISKLPAGKYKLTETIAPEGYILSTETVEFEVKETGDIQTAVMYNSPKIKVPNTGKKTSVWVYLISIFLMLSGSFITIRAITRKS